MKSIDVVRSSRAVSRIALAMALVLPAASAWSQVAPETQSAADPASAQDQADTDAGKANNPGPGNAPTTQAATDTSVAEEIVVTAQFRAENLQDTPLAITAMSASMLEARSQTDISQVAVQAPSVTLKPQGAAFGPALGANIRGIGQFDFNPALEPGVGVYVDDVYYATLTGSIFDLLDLERVEILRGPQGTLAGKNSIGGAVKLYSKRPTGDGSGYLSATYGSRDRLDLRGSIDFPLTDTLFARVAGVAKKQDGYVKRLDFGCVNPPGSALNPTVGPDGVPRTAIPTQLPSSNGSCLVERDGEIDYNAVRGQLRFAPNDDFEVNIAGDYTHDDRNVAGSVLLDRSFNGARVSPNYNTAARFDIDPFTPNTAPVSTRIPLDTRFLCGKFCNYASFRSLEDANQPFLQSNGRTNFEGWGVSGNIEWQLNDDMELVSISAYRAYRSIFTNDDDLSPLAHSFGRGNLSFWSFSQEVRLNGSLLDDAIEYTVGGFYMDQRSVYRTLQGLRYAGQVPFVGNDPVNADTKAAFAHVAWRPVDPLTLTAGIRYTDEHKDYTFSRRALDGSIHPQLGALNGRTGNYNGSRWDYRLNAQYEITPDVTTYAQYSTGFKGGGISPRPFFPEQVLPFGPEKLESYEVGLKTELFDRLVRLNLAAYRSNYDDIQLSLSFCPGLGSAPPAPCALIANAGDARIQGFEVETTVRPVEGFLVDGALSYVDFEYKDINPNAGGSGRPNGPQFGDYPIYTPKWKWSIGAQYEIDLNGAGSLTPRIDAAYQSAIYTNATNRPSNHIGSYTLANARLTWANAEGDLEISGEVTNLFDKYYHLTLFDLTIANAGVASAQPGRPREWALTVKKRF